MVFEKLNVYKEGAVLFAEIAAPPMNLLGPERITSEPADHVRETQHA
jgi:hypothetical protein